MNRWSYINLLIAMFFNNIKEEISKLLLIENTSAEQDKYKGFIIDLANNKLQETES